MLGKLVFGGPQEEQKLETHSFLQLLKLSGPNVPAVCLLGRGGGQGAALGQCGLSKEWSVCALSLVIKEKEIFHWVLSEGFYSASVL